ncbi:bifunctional N-acetylglucosamine-1-phosphate uridyltransferase/glucosamine-1-phosphate acetyltransferase [Desulfopila sp. IMCC35006]|uniref:bifunctional UDP-N-acetylglucosamine diphosphorylase/glucosamine-1-phosphate N-acetyltransferase GlmU n=1 Tax=Desulfopila sp. IMCC35006 TaxID=2569542 RepID=UPI0010ACFE40|nr:sugar phosphate nucleotidyltransferase [Desulfopila sp. IMCC35006]TKB23835.1 bifunctional N-acetylglucosamine-1-phosphate uridyltransferase/glucosamine-1-phosphate acetyltransferase [Desulfopila sp. IMCC35006]
MTSPSLSVIILAAGKGTRMKSDKAKVLHEVFYAPMIHHVINATLPLHSLQTVIIIGHQKDEVEQSLVSFSVTCVVQKEQLGTGHAVLVAEQALSEEADTVMILCGDTPLIQAETLQEMYACHQKSGAKLTLMTTVLDNPTNYGRIVSDTNNKIQGIVEQKDATAEQRRIKEINAGIYCVDKDFLFSSLKKVGTDNSQGEVYLTDIVKLAVEDNLAVEKYLAQSPVDVLGVNSRIELAGAQNELQMRRNRTLMLQGVTINNPQTVTVSPESSIERDTLLEPLVSISAGSRIGHSCRIGQGTLLQDCNIANNVTIGPYSCLSGTTVAAGTILPPFSKT